MHPWPILVLVWGQTALINANTDRRVTHVYVYGIWI